MDELIKIYKEEKKVFEKIENDLLKNNPEVVIYDNISSLDTVKTKPDDFKKK